MQITITVSDKVIKQAILTRLEDELIHDFDNEVTKRAGVGKLQARVSEIFEDPKFQKDLEKSFTAAIDVEDCLSDSIYDMSIPLLTALVKTCNTVEQGYREEMREREEAAEVARVVKILEKAGYKITK